MIRPLTIRPLFEGRNPVVSWGTPDRAVSTHRAGSPKDWSDLSFWMRLVVLAKRTAVLFEGLIAILQSRGQCSCLPR
jgi:hypothetical protein